MVCGKIDLSEELFWEFEHVREEMVPRLTNAVRGLSLAQKNNPTTAKGMQPVREKQRCRHRVPANLVE